MIRAWAKANVPWLRPVRDEVVFHVKRPWRWLRARTVPLRFYRLPGGRGWRSLLSNRLHISIMRGQLKYTYRGLRCLRNPIDLALYLQILQELSPTTVIEIGTKEGGSAVWFGDMLKVSGMQGKVYSIDLEPPPLKVLTSNVWFLRGDESDLGGVDLDWGRLPHPWLVIQDASHQYAGVLKSLRFLNKYMVAGDYLVVEDGYLAELGEDWSRSGGPGRAIAEFLWETDGWEIDERYCDWFGANVTANTNGWLVKR